MEDAGTIVKVECLLFNPRTGDQCLNELKCEVFYHEAEGERGYIDIPAYLEVDVPGECTKCNAVFTSDQLDEIENRAKWEYTKGSEG